MTLASSNTLTPAASAHDANVERRSYRANRRLHRALHGSRARQHKECGIDAQPYFFPIVVAQEGVQTRQRGTSFMISPNVLMTCRHVVDVSLGEGESLVAVDQVSGEMRAIQAVRFPSDPNLDLAVVLDTVDRPMYLPILPADYIKVGDDVHTYGFYSPSGRVETMRAGFFKGNLVAALQGPRPTVNLSYAVIEGLSGSPVLTYHNGVKVVGVCFGSENQRVLASEVIEVVEGETRYRETINRVVELGLAYQTRPVVTFLQELGLPFEFTALSAQPLQ